MTSPDQARWHRDQPRRFPQTTLDRAIHRAFPARILSAEPLSGGLCNANFKIALNSREPVVLRIYEHDPALCQKEIDIFA